MVDGGWWMVDGGWWMVVVVVVGGMYAIVLSWMVSGKGRYCVPLFGSGGRESDWEVGGGGGGWLSEEGVRHETEATD